MAISNVNKFLERVKKDKLLQDRIFSKRNSYRDKNLSNILTRIFIEEDVIPVATEEGLTFTYDEFLQVCQKSQSGLLSDDDLTDVSGGVNPFLAMGLSLATLLPNAIYTSVSNQDNNIAIVKEQSKPALISEDLKEDEEDEEDVDEETLIDDSASISSNLEAPRLQIPKKGIDVSVYQGNIDWQRVKASGVDFAIIRIGYGWGKVDKRFKQNVEGAKAAGIKVGVYLYSYATNKAQAQAEANFVLEQLKGINLDYPVCYDVEDRNTQGRLSKSQLTEVASTFLSAIKAAGYRASLYSFVSWLNTKFDMNALNDFDVWVAQWSSACTLRSDYGMWQYSETGRVPGISGTVDMNYSYKDY